MSGEHHIEQYEFHCQPCNYEWQMTYEVRTAAASDAPHFFYLNGLPATPPIDGRLCPNCWGPSHSCQKLDEPVLVPSRR